MLNTSFLDKKLKSADPAASLAKQQLRPPSGLGGFSDAVQRDAAAAAGRDSESLMAGPDDAPSTVSKSTKRRDRPKRARRWLAAGLVTTLALGSGVAVVSARSLGFFGAHSSQDGNIWCVNGNGARVVDFVSSDPIKDCERPRDREDYAILSNGSHVAVVLKEDLPKNDGKTVTVQGDEILRGTWKFATAAEVVPPVNKREFFATLSTDHATEPQTCVTLSQRKEWLAQLAKRLEVNPPAVTRGIPKRSFWSDPEYALYAWSEGRPSGDDCTYLTYSARTHTVFVRKTQETPTVYPDSPAYATFLQTIDSALDKCSTLSEVKAFVDKAKMAKGVDLDALQIHYVESPHGECTRLTYAVGGVRFLKFWGPGPSNN